MILSMQYHKSCRDENKSAEEGMGCLRIKANGCIYKKDDRWLKQLINGINNEMMTAKILKELATIQKTSDIISEQVLSWAKRIEAQRDQTAMLTTT